MKDVNVMALGMMGKAYNTPAWSSFQSAVSSKRSPSASPIHPKSVSPMGTPNVVDSAHASETRDIQALPTVQMASTRTQHAAAFFSRAEMGGLSFFTSSVSGSSSDISNSSKSSAAVNEGVRIL